MVPTSQLKGAAPNPSFVSCKVVSATQARLAWRPAPHATSYVVRPVIRPSGTAQPPITVTDTTMVYAPNMTAAIGVSFTPQFDIKDWPQPGQVFHYGVPTYAAPTSGVTLVFPLTGQSC
jgi:hypothetical protein